MLSSTPEAQLAHKLTWQAIKAGTLVRKPCEVCGKPRAEAHHPDYLRPLKVRWLCTRHHLHLLITNVVSDNGRSARHTTDDESVMAKLASLWRIWTINRSLR